MIQQSVICFVEFQCGARLLQGYFPVGSGLNSLGQKLGMANLEIGQFPLGVIQGRFCRRPVPHRLGVSQTVIRTQLGQAIRGVPQGDPGLSQELLLGLNLLGGVGHLGFLQRLLGLLDLEIRVRHGLLQLGQLQRGMALPGFLQQLLRLLQVYPGLSHPSLQG